MKLINKSYPLKRISPQNEHFFFGYYDLHAFNKSQRLHLAHKSAFANRLQNKNDTVDICVIDLQTGRYQELDKTGAWNFQQGAMLQWNPTSAENEIIYNSMEGTQYVGIIMDINTGKKRYLDMPVANVSPTGEFALSINFSRLYHFRPGYGYAKFPDRYSLDNHSDKDGIFLIDLLTGKSRQIISMQDIWDFSGSFFKGRDEKIIINHITFNTDGSRFLFLVRNFPQKGEKHKTAVITANCDGSDMFLLADYGIASHYHWKNSKEVIFFIDGKELSYSCGEANNYVLTDQSHEGYMIADGFFADDNHMSYSPDRKLMITDTYPDEDRMQTLRLYDMEENICINLGEYYSMKTSDIDIRCDLHPRWNRKGDMISFDSTHEGYRGIYLLDLR